MTKQIQNPREWTYKVRPVRDSYTINDEYISSRTFISSENIDELNAYLFRNGELINTNKYYIADDGTNDIIYVDSTSVLFIEGDIFIADYVIKEN